MTVVQNYEEAERELRRLLAAHGVTVELEREEYECSQIHSPAQWKMSGPLTVLVSELLPLLEYLAAGTEEKVRRARDEGLDEICLRWISLQAGPDFSCSRASPL